jgi:exonuclease III
MHHGVAILSRLPLKDPGKHDWQDNGEARHIGVRLPNGIRLENVYVPAGGDIPDRAQNPKFGQKLDFLERMTRWSEQCGCPTIMVGDFNVAPLECDVWSHRQLVGVVSHTPVEVEALTRLRRSGSTPGGAIARRTGPGTTAAAASTICGRPATSPPWPGPTGSTSPAATGPGPRTTCR